MASGGSTDHRSKGDALAGCTRGLLEESPAVAFAPSKQWSVPSVQLWNMPNDVPLAGEMCPELEGCTFVGSAGLLQEVVTRATRTPVASDTLSTAAAAAAPVCCSPTAGRSAEFEAVVGAGGSAGDGAGGGAGSSAGDGAGADTSEIKSRGKSGALAGRGGGRAGGTSDSMSALGVGSCQVRPVAESSPVGRVALPVKDHPAADTKVMMPVVGLGTYRAKGQSCYDAVLAALKAGYRAVDTARVYGNERDVGAAVKDSGIPRQELFVTTKLSPRNQGESKAERAVYDSLERLQMDYIDLVLIHWPGTQGKKISDPVNPSRRLGTWIALQRLLGAGVVRSIGISNYTRRHLDELLKSPECVVRPSALQIEVHPLYQQKELRAYASSLGINVTAYTSLGEGRDDLLAHPQVVRIAELHSKSPAQVLLRWGLQSGMCVIPKTITLARLEPNVDLFDFQLSAEDMEALGALDSDRKLCWDPKDVV